MATNVKFNCIEAYSKNNSWNFKEYDTNCVIWRGKDTKTYFSLNQNGSFKRIKNSVQAYSGTWICDGNSNFILMGANETYYSSDGFKKREKVNQPTPTTGIDSVFSCIQGYLDQDGRKLTSQKGGNVTFRTKNKTTPSIWVFSKIGRWSLYSISEKKITNSGKWECIGTASFSIISANGRQWISSDNLGWVDIAEPTTEPTTGVGGFQWKDTDITIDQLKSGKTVSVGMRGPIVKQIQELLIGKGYKEVSKSGQPDSMFGRMTKTQVEKFQSENKDDKEVQLVPDGIVGQKTINALLKVTDEDKIESGAVIPKTRRLATKGFGEIPNPGQ